MSNVTYKTAEEILIKAKSAVGKTLGVIDVNQRLEEGKGGVGHVIEESLFEYKINSSSRPDFPEAGVELKVTPFIKKKNGYTAKERLVLNIINYEKEYKKQFEESSFWQKNNTLLIMFYEYIKNIAKSDYKIQAAILYKYPLADLEIIKADWEKIVGKIRVGKAHEISEGDTLYLGACTKGSTSEKSYRQQPFSKQLARQRAYSLKQSYMTYVLRHYALGQGEDERIIKDVQILEDSSLEKYIIDKVQPYLNKSQQELCDLFALRTKPKNINEIIISKILNLQNNITKTEEFQKANIKVKTIRVNTNGSIKESMSFPYFNFCDIINEEWETSSFKTLLESTKFLFVIFQFDESNTLYLKKVMFWNMPVQDLDEVKKVWEKTVKIIKSGVKITKTKRGCSNNLPNLTDNPVAHVRPHGQNSLDTLPLPTGGNMTKQCFWLNNNYIKKQVTLNEQK